jgi:Flp pilus assembly CpaF family ATPase
MISTYLAKLPSYLDNPLYSEVVATRFGELGLERADGTGFEFVSAPEFDRRFWEVLCIAIANDTGQLFNADHPRVAAKLPGGHRFEAILGGVVESGISVAIRLKRLKYLQLSDFEISTLDQIKLLKCLRDESPIIISGGTSSGKTTLLNTLIQHIPLEKRIVCVEDTAEVELPIITRCGLYYRINPATRS